MQHTFLLSALAATAFAQTSSNQDDQATGAVSGLVSVISVLETALPSTLIQEALTNSAAVAADISSEFAAGSTPAWFTALPSDVQTYLVPSQLFSNASNATATGTLISATPINSANATGAGGNSTASSTGRRSTITNTATETGDMSSETGASSTQGGSSSSSSAGASMPSAVYGMGLAGAVGLVGVLAL